MAYVSDRKFAEEQCLNLEQTRKLIRSLDIPFVSSGKGEKLVYMFDPEQLDRAVQDKKTRRRERRRRPRPHLKD